MKHVLFVDRACRGNPGPASAGAVLYAGEKEVGVVSKPLGVQTNNYAEYMSLILGLEMAASQKIKNLTVYADSQLMVRQINGQYKVKHPGLKPLFEKAKILIAQFDSFAMDHVRRELNQRADALANQALDA
jgi:ribonuclease HI